jgi:CheY-like chemotaxis protein
MPMPAMDDSSHVLVVEDDANALSGYLEFLEAAGFEATGVSSGADALPIALRQPPAAVVTDIMMPGMNGFELATALHCDLRTRHVPVIGLTAHWTADVRERATDAAMRAVLLKPCVPSHLIAELERVLEPGRDSNPGAPARNGGALAPEGPARRDCLECGLKKGMKLQDIVPSGQPLADPFPYICVRCGAELTIPPPPSKFPRI